MHVYKSDDVSLHVAEGVVEIRLALQTKPTGREGAQAPALTWIGLTEQAAIKLAVDINQALIRDA